MTDPVASKKSATSKYNEDMAKNSAKAFENHSIVSRGNGRWLIQRKRPSPHDSSWDSTYAAEIIVLMGGKILVSGDVYPVIFAFGPRDERSLLEWIGCCSDVPYYVLQKACIGMGSDQLVTTWDRDVAIGTANELIEEMEAEHAAGNSENGKSQAAAVRAALENAGYDRHEFVEGIASGFKNEGLSAQDAYELVCDIGTVADGRVWYAHAAIAKLVDLLEQEEAANVEGQQRSEGERDRPS